MSGPRKQGGRRSAAFADRIVKTRDFIVVEALTIRNTLPRVRGKRGLDRAIAEQGWREFFDIRRGKAESASVPFFEVPPAGTSHARSRCGTKVPRTLSEQIHRCGVCGLEPDRVEHVAKNVPSRGLRIFAGVTAADGTAPGSPAASTAR